MVSVEAHIVSIPPQLSERLKPFGHHFIRVESHQKKPEDNEWGKNPNAWYDADSPDIRDWLANGGNYGVVCG